MVSGSERGSVWGCWKNISTVHFSFLNMEQASSQTAFADERRQYAAEQRKKFSVPEVLKPDGSINQEYG